MRRITNFIESFESLINSESFQNGFIPIKNGEAVLDFKAEFNTVKDGDIIHFQREINLITQDVIIIKFTDKEKAGLYLDYEVTIFGEEFDFVAFENAVANGDCLIGFFAKNYGISIIEEKGISPMIVFNSAKFGIKKEEKLVDVLSYQYLYSMILFEDTLVLNTDTSSLNDTKLHFSSKQIKVSDITYLSLDVIADRGILNIHTTEEKIIVAIDLKELPKKIGNFLIEVEARRWFLTPLGEFFSNNLF